jgi:putative ATP-binding cassette transporter
MTQLRTLKANRSKVVRFFLTHSPGVIVPAMLASIVAGVGGAYLMMLINTRLSRGVTASSELLPLVIVVTTAVLVSNIVAGLLSNYLAHTVCFDLRMYICKHMLAAPLRHVEEFGDDRLLAALTQDISNVVNAFFRLPLLFSNVAIILGCFFFLGKLSLLLLAALLAFLILSVLSYIVVQRKANHYFALGREEYGNSVRNFRGLHDGAKELRLNKARREAFFENLLQPAALSERTFNLRGGTIYALLNGFSQVLYFVAIIIFLFVLPALVTIELPVLLGYALIVLYMAGPMQGIVYSVPVYITAGISLKKIEELGLTFVSSQLNAPSLPVTLPEIRKDWQQIDLIGVTHRYEREHDSASFTLGPINLSFYAGELVFVVGGNGGGKTTFAKLLAGLYTPDSGKILLDNQPITDQNRDWYCQHFSAVYSDFYVFEQLLGIDSERLNTNLTRYLAELQLKDKVQIKDGRFSTTRLSLGQRKRLALLVAYLEDRPFYIFDEWAADQDPHFKDVFYHEILKELKARGKTILIITHDDRYYNLADRLIKFEAGSIVSASPQLARATPQMQPK